MKQTPLALIEFYPANSFERKLFVEDSTASEVYQFALNLGFDKKVNLLFDQLGCT